MQFLLNHSIVFFLILPLFTSVILFVFKNKFFSLFSILFICLFLIFITIFNIFHIKDLNISYVFGSFDKRYAIEFLFNKQKGLMLLLIYVMAFFNIIFHIINKFFNSYFYLFFFLFLSGVSGIVLVNDLFSFYVFIEVMSISGYGLFMVKKNSTIFKNVFKYLINNSIASIFLLIGILFVYKISNTLNISILAEEYSNNFSLSISLMFIIFALFLKIGLYPMHFVVFNLYQELGNPANLIFQSVLSKIFFFIVLNFIFLMQSYGLVFVEYLTYFSCILLVLISININFFKKINEYIAMISIYQFSYLISIITLIKNKELIFNNLLKMISINAFVHFLFLSIIYKYANLLENFSITKFTSLMSLKKFEKFLVIFCLLILTGIPVSYIFFFKFLILKQFILNKKLFFACCHIISSIFLLNMNFKILYNILIPKITIKSEILNSIETDFKMKFFYIFLLIIIISISIL